MATKQTKQTPSTKAARGTRGAGDLRLGCAPWPAWWLLLLPLASLAEPPSDKLAILVREAYASQWCNVVLPAAQGRPGSRTPLSPHRGGGASIAGAL